MYTQSECQIRLSIRPGRPPPPGRIERRIWHSDWVYFVVDLSDLVDNRPREIIMFVELHVTFKWILRRPYGTYGHV